MDSSGKKADRRKKKIDEMKRKVANMTKEQIQAAISKKKECNARAMQVVERMIEHNVEEKWLIENLIYINQSHFQDAVEERAIVKYCGYPLCDNSLEGIPVKQYHISTKQNKVFDITDRKNYCTNVCYRAGVYLKDQLYTSPLWLRDCEHPIMYKLLEPWREKGSSGLEIDLGNIKPCVTTIHKQENEKTNNTASEEIEDKSSSEDENNKMDVDSESTSGQKDPPGISMPDVDFKDTSKKIENNAIEDMIVEKSLTDRKSQSSKRKVTSTTFNPVPSVSLSVKVENVFTSWITVDTLVFCFGQDKVKEMFIEFGKPLNESYFNPEVKKSYIFEKYTEICRKLDLMELKDRDIQVPMKPPPDYEELKKEAENIEIKVQSFFKGDKIAFKTETENDGKNEDNEEILSPILPLIEKHSVMKTRRDILFDRINKTLPDIQSALSLNQFNLRKDTKLFINTLSLTANNIVMKPAEWNLLCILLLKLFSLQNEYLSFAYVAPMTQKRVINLLLAYNLDTTYLDRQLINMTNLEQIIRNTAQ